MPNFYFSEEEIEAITAAVLGFNATVSDNLKAHKKAPDIYKEGHRLVKQYNCQGCHQIETEVVS